MNQMLKLLCIICFILVSKAYANNIIDVYKNDGQESIWIYTKARHNNVKCFSFSNPSSLLFLSQTCIDLNNKNNIISEYNRLILGVLYLTSHYDRILMIGLGGGVMPTIMSQLLPDSKIDIVEISSNVVKIARNEFGFEMSDNMNLFIQDGFEFLKNNNKKYDIIIIDAFDHEYIPKYFLTDVFFKNLVNSLNKTGVVALNSFTHTNYSKSEDKLYEKFFDQKIQLFTSNGGNKVVFNSLQHNRVNIDDVKLRHKIWQDKITQFNLKKSFLINKIVKYL